MKTPLTGAFQVMRINHKSKYSKRIIKRAKLMTFKNPMPVKKEDVPKMKSG